VAESGSIATLQQPFPGLRSFVTDESLFFFGRESHTQALLERLSRSRLLGVIGGSGGGKSSLVRAGLLPALYRGYLAGSSSRWRIAVMLPGSDPLEGLARALADAGLQGDLRGLLSATSMGLVHAAQAAELPAGESLLVVVDQFEELFRPTGDDTVVEGSDHFVRLLLNAVDRSTPPVYAVLTMRYEYLADCARFEGLPEALNASQYLIPRLTREQRQAAVEGPLRLADIPRTARVVQAFLNEAGEDPYQLPVLQHALRRTLLRWQEAGATGPIDLVHYDAAGRLQNALNNHADEIFKSLSPSQQNVAERVFRCLTVTDEARRVTRRRSSFARLCEVVTADREDIATVVKRFASQSLVLLSAPELGPEVDVDISHESLISRWRLLDAWTRKEAASAALYREVATDTLRYRSGEGGAWRDPELAKALRLRHEEGWNPAWARQYWRDDHPPTFSDAIGFLDQSRSSQVRFRRLIAGLVLTAVLALGYAIHESFKAAATAQKKAEAEFRLSEAAKEKAEAVAGLTKQLSEMTTKVTASQADAKRLEEQLASADPAEKESLRKELAKAKAAAAAELKAAGDKASELQKANQGLVQRGDEHEALAKRNADLARQLDEANALIKQLKIAPTPVSPAPVSPTPIPSQRGSGGLLQKTEGNLAWFDYLEMGRQQLKGGHADRALVYLYAAAALNPKSTLDDGSNANRAYFPHYELAEALLALGETAAAAQEIRLEEAAGVIAGNKDFSARLERLKGRLPSAAGSKK
jgi:cytoskeletal protein RodZ